MALSIYPVLPADCTHVAFYPGGEARCPWCGSTRAEIEKMGVTEQWVDATTLADAAAGIRREVSNLGSKRVVDVRGTQAAFAAGLIGTSPDRKFGISSPGSEEKIRELIAQGLMTPTPEIEHPPVTTFVPRIYANQVLSLGSHGGVKRLSPGEFRFGVATSNSRSLDGGPEMVDVYASGMRYVSRVDEDEIGGPVALLPEVCPNSAHGHNWTFNYKCLNCGVIRPEASSNDYREYVHRKDSFYPPLLRVIIKEADHSRVDSVAEARAVGAALLADLKGIPANDIERAAYEYVVERNSIPAVAGEDLQPGDVVTVRDGKAYRMPRRTAGPQQHTFTMSKETFDRIMESGCTGFSIEGHATTREPAKHPCPTVGGHCDMANPKRCCSNCGRSMELLARLDDGALDTLGDDWRGVSKVISEYDIERVPGCGRMDGVTTVKTSNTAWAKPFVHPRSLKGNVNVPALAVDDPNGSDVCEEW